MESSNKQFFTRIYTEIFKHPFILISLLVCCTVIGLLFLQREKNIKNSDSTGQSIVAFGDSLVQGVGASPQDNWVSLLGNKTGEQIINLGRSGDTTKTALDRIDSVLATRPKLVLILLGGNDYLWKAPIEDTFKNLSTIIEKIQASGSAVIVLGIRGGIINDQFKDRFIEITDIYDTGYVPDVLDGIINNKELMSDPIHPNAKGYELITNKILPEFTEVLKIMEQNRPSGR